MGGSPSCRRGGTRPLAVLAVLAIVGLLPGLPAVGDHLATGTRINQPIVAPEVLVADWQVSADGRWAVFASDPAGGDVRLWTVDLTGPAPSAPLPLSPAVPGHDVGQHLISPDSSTVLFIGAFEPDGKRYLYRVPVDGSAPYERLSDPPGAGPGVANIFSSGPDGTRYGFDFTPDGSRVVYLAEPAASSRYELFSVPTDGSAPPIQLSSIAPTDDRDIEWSRLFELNPDGSRVVFQATFDDPDIANLYSAPVDAPGGQVQLSSTANIAATVGRYRVTDDHVVFLADLETPDQFDLYRASVDTAALQQRLSTVPDLAGGDVVQFAVSPDGSRVVYRGNLGPVLDSFRLYSRRVDGSTPQLDLAVEPLTFSTMQFWPVAMSPDGTRVLYFTKEASHVQLNATTPGAAGNGMVLSGDPDVVGSITATQLAFTPDGTEVLHAAGFQPAELYASALDGSGSRQVSAPSADGADGFYTFDRIQVSGDHPRVVYRASPTVGAPLHLYSTELAGDGSQVRLDLPSQPMSRTTHFRATSTNLVLYRGDHVTDDVFELFVTAAGALPPAPTGVIVPGVRTRQVDVSWSLPTFHGQRTGGRVTAVPDGGGTPVVEVVGASATTLTLTGLAPDTDYTVSVQSTNDAGDSYPATAKVRTLAEDATPIPDRGLTRLFGDDRFATAAAVALARFNPADVDTIYLATGGNFPDALAGGPLAAANGAPILLTSSAGLPDATAAALEALAPATVVALGGPAAVSDEVLADAADAAGGATTDRVFGDDRYGTAAAIAAELGPRPAVLLATGINFPDALAGGPAAHVGDAVILLSAGDRLPAATADALSALAPDTITALGGDAAVPGQVLTDASVAAGGAATDRLAGDTRYETAIAIAGRFGQVPEVMVATGTVFADALAAGPAAALAGTPIVLTAPTTLPETVATYLEDLVDLQRIVVLGGPAAVAEAVADLLVVLLDP